MNKYLLKITNALFGVLMLFSVASCESDFLETSPTDSVSETNATSTADNLMLIINGIHRSMYVRQGGQGFSGIGGQMIIQDSYGEDLVHPAVGLNWHMDVVRWQSQMDENGFTIEYPYSFYYRMIRNANMIITDGEKASGDQVVKEKAIGEAYAYRAFFYHQLVQLYGKRYVAGSNGANLGVPLRLTPTEEPLPRATVEEVYTQINKDLDKALTYLNGKNRVHKSHFNTNVVYGLKARVALTQGRWADAANFARLARQGFSLMSNADYMSGFNKLNNNEWIWGIEIISDQTDGAGNFGGYMSRNFNASTIRLAPKAMSKKLFDAFPSSDVRTKVVDPTGKHEKLSLPANFVKFPYTSQKFLAVSTSDARMDVPLMRAAEMYLIEAEALARAGREADSKVVFSELELNRNPEFTSITKTGQAYIDQILLSRRIELWGEGFRFFDLKRLAQGLDRTGSNHNEVVINGVYTVAPTDKRWQYLIPKKEVDASGGLIVQNDK